MSLSRPLRAMFPPPEAAVWLAGLLVLVVIDPGAPGRPDLCPFHHLGLGDCPGCGLGRSIHHLARGSLAASFEAHPLGIPALLVLGRRIWTLTIGRQRAAGAVRAPRTALPEQGGA